MIAHIGDFGIARLLSKAKNNNSQGQPSSIGVGTIGYMAPEYGMGSDATTCGDVYSFGIILLEILTGKRPSDELFEDGLNLHNFVKAKLSGPIAQILDTNLIKIGDVQGDDSDDDDDGQIKIQEINVGIENVREDEEYIVQKCILSVLEIGLACSDEAPGDRIKIRDAARNLNIIMDALMTRQRQANQRSTGIVLF